MTAFLFLGTTNGAGFQTNWINVPLALSWIFQESCLSEWQAEEIASCTRLGSWTISIIYSRFWWHARWVGTYIYKDVPGTYSCVARAIYGLWMYRLINDTSRLAAYSLSLYLCLQSWLLLCQLRRTTRVSSTLHHLPGHTTCKCTQVLTPLKKLRWGSGRCILLWWCPLEEISKAVELYLECK